MKVRDILADREMALGPPASDGPWRHWRLARDGDVAWLLLDKAGARVNTLDEAVMRELDAAVRQVEQDRPAGLVIRSAKAAGFAMGADIGEFGRATGAQDIEAAIHGGNAIFDRIEALPFPTVAVVHGYCLGGGLELVLACDRRIAIDGARLGFPEIMLGLIPGFGGTVRATRLIDPTEAMKLMLTGRAIRARRALKLGLVDLLAEERHVDAAVAAAVAGGLAARGRGPLARIYDFGPARRLAANRMRAEARKRAAQAHYPAPYELIGSWEAHGDDPRAMRQAETAAFSRLIAGETAQNLIRVFHLRDALKKMTGPARDFGHVHVIGAGAMGGDIAAWCAWRGLSVTLADLDPRALARAVSRAARLYRRIGDRRTETRDALDRLTPDLAGDGLARADVVIEAVPEELALKHKVLAAAERRLKADALLATNTSSIPLEALREGLKRPERLVGLHFFNPVSRMQLVEIVAHDGADAEVLAAARAFVGRIDRLPAPVRSAPGFLVNRALMPYLVEALAMMDEGARAETIDNVATRFGMPMGPIELADTVGLDICAEVARVLAGSLDRPMPPVPDWLMAKIEAGDFGRKTGRGIYRWKDDQPVKAREAPEPDPGMSDRLILPMVDACVACLREGIVADAETLDAAMIFATGFAPFRGGPLNYARARGIADVKASLDRLAERHGDRFRPDPGWDALG